MEKLGTYHCRSAAKQKGRQLKRPFNEAGAEDWGNRRGTRGGSRHKRRPLRYRSREAAALLNFSQRTIVLRYCDEAIS
jgi:hypothetical protein